MVRITVIFSIFVCVRPFISDPALTVDALFRVDVKITLITCASLLATLLTNRPLRRVVACRALRAEVFSLVLVDEEVAIFRAKLALA